MTKKICSNCKKNPTFKETVAGAICTIVPTPGDDKNGDCIEWENNSSKYSSAAGDNTYYIVD